MPVDIFLIIQKVYVHEVPLKFLKFFILESSVKIMKISVNVTSPKSI